jgi:hypothetical protein
LPLKPLLAVGMNHYLLLLLLETNLKKLETYAGTLIHELIHAKTGYSDVSREFEIELTKYIGIVYESLLMDSHSADKE